MSKRIPRLWDTASTGMEAPDFNGEVRLGYRLIVGGLIAIVTLFVIMGFPSPGYVGAGIGCYGSAIGIWMEYKRREI